jgi:hypothetical protein
MTSACHACLGHQAAAAISHCGNGRWCGMPLKPCQPQCRPWCRPAPFCVISVHVDLWWVVSAAFRIHVLRVSRAWPSVVFPPFLFSSLGHPLRRPRSTTPPPHHPPVLPLPAALVAVVPITFQVTQRLPPRPLRLRLPRLRLPRRQSCVAMPVPVVPVHHWQATLPRPGLLWCRTPT